MFNSNGKGKVMNKETKVDHFIDMELRDWFAGQAIAHLAGMLHPGA